MDQKKDVSMIHYFMILPGVGFIVLFLGSSIFITVAQSFGLFSVTGTSRFTFVNWKTL
jgi:putative spermidine/putrescine transport system permease protein